MLSVYTVGELALCCQCISVGNWVYVVSVYLWGIGFMLTVYICWELGLCCQCISFGN